VLTANPSADHFDLSLVKLATALAAQGKFGAAGEALVAALRLDPDDAEALIQFGTLQMHRGQVEHAERLLRRAAEVEPANVQTRVRLARALLAQEKADQAMEQLQKAERLQPDHPELAEVLRMLGQR
jgi:tetratricopeptide (TPR) repeat protein